MKHNDILLSSMLHVLWGGLHARWLVTAVFVKQGQQRLTAQGLQVADRCGSSNLG